MIKVAIVEDNRLLRDGLAIKLREQPDFTVSYSAANDGAGHQGQVAPPERKRTPATTAGAPTLLHALSTARTAR